MVGGIRVLRWLCTVAAYRFTECKNLKEIVVLSMAPPEVQGTTFNLIPPSVVVRVPAAALDAYRQHPVWGRFGRLEELERGLPAYDPNRVALTSSSCT